MTNLISSQMTINDQLIVYIPSLRPIDTIHIYSGRRVLADLTPLGSPKNELEDEVFEALLLLLFHCGRIWPGYVCCTSLAGLQRCGGHCCDSERVTTDVFQASQVLNINELLQPKLWSVCVWVCVDLSL